MREIYLRAFEAAVREAHVGAIMDSYNPLNGVHATQNAHLNNDIAKKDWGFDGVIMSDWDATYDAVAAANGGLDLEMPSAKFMNRQNLLPAAKDGRVSEEVINDKVRRILRQAIRFGFLDHEQQDLSIPNYNVAARKIAQQVAVESLVLLKNAVSFTLQKRDLSYYDIAKYGWTAEPGSFEVLVGRSSADIQLRGSFTLQ